MYTFLVIFQVIVAISLIALVLLQQGKGADAGAAFGSGASGTVFGSRGSANFLSRATAWLAAVFFGVSLALAYLVNAKTGGTSSVVDSLPAAAEVMPAKTIVPTISIPATAPVSASPPAVKTKPTEPAPKLPE